jgi:predicted transcriptional regulator
MLPDLNEICRRRKMLNLTQAELAKRAGVSRSLIAKLETGRLNPSYMVAKRIFDVLEALEREHDVGIKGVTASQIHNKPVEFAEASELIFKVWNRMKEKAYS